MVILLYDLAHLLDIAGPAEVFRAASHRLQERKGDAGLRYSVQLVSAGGGAVATSCGAQLVTSPIGEAPAPAVLIVPGGAQFPDMSPDSELSRWLRRHVPGVARLVGMSTGVIILGSAGSLNSRRVTTHWQHFSGLRSVAPKSDIDRDAIYVRDGNVYTCAGATASVDLALNILEEDLGHEFALSVAQELVTYLNRPGGQAQFQRVDKMQKVNDPFEDMDKWILENPRERLTIDVLAKRLGVGERQFIRRCWAIRRLKPTDYVRQLRVEHARRRIVSGETNLRAIALGSGFSTTDSLRMAFQRVLGLTPAEYRQRFGEDITDLERIASAG